MKATMEYLENFKPDIMEVTGLAPAEVYFALYQNAMKTEFTPRGATPAALLRFLHADSPLTLKEVQEEITGGVSGDTFFPDYFRGVPMKIMWFDVEDRSFIARSDLYDRDHGEGSCHQTIVRLFETKNKTGGKDG